MKNSRYKKFFLPLLLAAVLVTTSAFKSDFFEIAKQIEIFTTMFKELNMNYVDETNPGDLMDTAIKSMLNDLDPYTNFMNEQDVEAARINNTGDYSGIGASVLTLKDKLVIMETYKDFPADKAGLKPGDEIIKVDNISVADFKEDAGNLLQGAEGSTINLTYVRQGETKSAEVKRESVEIHAVPHYAMVDGEIGYIVLRKFNEKASSETIKALRELKGEGATKIILDLRGNPGGLLAEAVNLVNIFVPQNQLVVSTKSKVEKYNKTYYTQKQPIDTDIPLVVLIDGRSASASEIVAGALQDLDRAVIVGSRSFGKGLVQRPKPLVYGTQMKITISRYYTPSGRCIQALDYWHRDEDGEATRISQDKYNAFKTRNGRTVYDGGGIEPDVKMSESVYSPITTAILDDYLIFDFATQYYYNNKVENLESFKLTDSDFNKFKEFLKKENFSFETSTEEAFSEAFDVANREQMDVVVNDEYNKLLNAIKNYKNTAIDANKSQLMGLLADEIVKRYFYREGLYKYYLDNNPEIKKGSEILMNSTSYSKYLK